MRWHGNIELGSFGDPNSAFFHRTGTGVEVAAILVQVNKYQIGITLKSIEDAVAMMRVNIHIGDTLYSMLFAQCFNCDTTVIEHAETGRSVTAGVV